jgi:hypothetical protein
MAFIYFYFEKATEATFFIGCEPLPRRAMSERISERIHELLHGNLQEVFGRSAIESALLWQEELMKNDNVAAVRTAYAVAERKDLEGWIKLFTPDGVFVDNSVGATYRGRALADPVRNYGKAFSNMHRELYHTYADGNGPAGHPRRPAAASLWRAVGHG